MASIAGSKASSNQPQQPANGEMANGKDTGSLPPQISKLSISDQSKSVKSISKKDVELSSDKKSPVSNQNGSAKLLTEKFNFSVPSPGLKQTPTEVDSPINEAKCSPGSSLDQEKKTSEYGSVKSSSFSGKVSDGTSCLAKTSGSTKVSDHGNFVESGKSSICRGSTSSDISDESSCSSFSSSISKPHKANDLRWEAIQVVRAKDGAMGLGHFRLLKKLGCGDIGSVYLSELRGTKCHFAMKVMDKNTLASRKKLLRAQTEREILQSLDHPFLPTLYTHFETEKFSCLVMEFCPGGDLHTLRQRQPGKHFPEQAVKYVKSNYILFHTYLPFLQPMHANEMFVFTVLDLT